MGAFGLNLSVGVDIGAMRPPGGDPQRVYGQSIALAYWPLRDLTDKRTSGYTLTNNNIVTFDADEGAEFVGASSQWLSRASNADLQIGNNTRVFDFFFRPSALNGILFCKEDEANRSYELYLTGGGKLQWYCYQGSYSFAEWGGTVSTGQLYYVQVFHDAANDLIGISVNGGAAVTTAFSSSGVQATTVDFQIGRFGGVASFYYTGAVRDFGVYNAMFTAEFTAWRAAGNALYLP